MNILIPIAGKGNRFVKAGYTTPKPFIEVKGTPMLVRVLNNISPHAYHDNVIIICNPDIYTATEDTVYAWADRRQFMGRTMVLSTCGEPQYGAAWTSLIAKPWINNTQELVITDCDHVVEDYHHIHTGVERFNLEGADAALWCHLNNNPKWSYTKVNDGRVVSVVEKEVVSNLANTGEYYYREGVDFVEAAEEMIAKNDKSKGEFYVAPTMNYLIARNKDVMVHVVNDMIGFGTPEDLKIAETKL